MFSIVPYHFTILPTVHEGSHLERGLFEHCEFLRTQGSVFPELTLKNKSSLCAPLSTWVWLYSVPLDLTMHAVDTTPVSTCGALGGKGSMTFVIIALWP